MPRMIVDVHSHVFPPAMIERRAELEHGDAEFRAALHELLGRGLTGLVLARIAHADQWPVGHERVAAQRAALLG